MLKEGILGVYRRLAILVLLIAGALPASSQQLYETSAGSIRFYSEAPQELIRASSQQLKGIIELKKRTFFFKVDITSFLGFNSPLQREHFNENYMESARFPNATYSGKIIEDIDLSTDGVYDVRVKGKMNIHGLERERIVKSQIIVKKGKINIASDFVVSLADHDINIPRVVYEKLAPDINVSVNATLAPKQQ